MIHLHIIDDTFTTQENKQKTTIHQDTNTNDSDTITNTTVSVFLSTQRVFLI